MNVVKVHKHRYEDGNLDYYHYENGNLPLLSK